MTDLQLKQVCKNFGDVEVIRDVDLEVQAGEFVVFVGPSGCGKSTLLRLIAGLEDVSSGTILIDGRDVTDEEPSNRGIAMVFQSYALYPHMTVAQNIGFGLSLAHRPKEKIRQKVEAAAETLQLTELLNRKPKALSGGQRQRVAIGRAIVRDPKVFLFDEPLSNLDAALRSQMRLELSELHKRLRATMIYVTHDQVEAMTMADRIVVVNKGRVEQVGSPMELYDHPKTPFVAGFIGSPKMNLYTGDFAKQKGCSTYGIRPEHITLSDASGAWKGRVRVIERLGADSLLHLNVEGAGEMTVRTEGNTPYQADSDVWLSPVEGKEHKFDTVPLKDSMVNRSIRRGTSGQE